MFPGFTETKYKEAIVAGFFSETLPEDMLFYTNVSVRMLSDGLFTGILQTDTAVEALWEPGLDTGLSSWKRINWWKWNIGYTALKKQLPTVCNIEELGRNITLEEQDKPFLDFLRIAEEPKSQKITEPARQGLASMTNTKIVDESMKVLDKFDNVLEKITKKDFPPIRTFAGDDGSILLEWIFLHWRVGFNIEINEEDSGWFLVSDKSFGHVNAYGSLQQVDIEWIVYWVLRQLNSTTG